MEIKEVKLESELNKVIEFLNSCDLLYEKGIDKTLYIEENNKIIATISKEGSTIKCLAVDKDNREDNLASTLVSAMINLMYQEGIYHIMVYTKIIYLNLFKSLGFKEIVSTDATTILETKTDSIEEVIKKIRYQIESRFNINIESEKINAIVINANPFTIGHLHLVEEARKNADYLLCFLLEEDKSFYSFKERMTLAYLATQCYENVMVIPSTKYIISNLTFPTYFLKEKDLKNHEWMLTDALIFKNYFMKLLNIRYRYVAKETDEVMVLYNNTLKEVLNDQLIEIDRLDNISASKVRNLVKENKIIEALDFIPQQIKQTFRLLSLEKKHE